MASDRLREASRDSGEEAAMDMSPMIDMVFLLLIFFIVVSTPLVVKMDAAVDVPIAKHAKKSEDKHGRIVLNVYEDGRFANEDGITEGGELLDEGEIARYVRDQAKIHNDLQRTPRLHLRGDQEAVFKHSRTAIRAAAEVGVDQVVFSCFPFKN